MSNQRLRSKMILATLMALLFTLAPIQLTPTAHATATSVEYLATNYTGTGTWSPRVGAGDATVVGSPPYGNAFGIKVSGTWPIRVPHSDITNLSTSELRTVQIWANVSQLPTSGEAEFFSKYGTDWDGYYLRLTSAGAVKLLTNSNVEISSSSPNGVVTPGQWHLITMVAQIGSTRKVYVDNSLVINTSATDVPHVNSGQVWVGGFTGCIGGFSAYKGELNASQIAAARDSFTASGITGTCPATVTVSYNGNSNTSGTAPTSSSATTDVSFAVASVGTLARTGYTFSGWNTRADGTGTDYTAGSSIPWNTGINTTLFAKWTANSLTVSYDANGGSTAANGSTSTTTGATMSSLATTSRAGYLINGWFTASSGGTQVTTTAGHGQTSNFTLFAQWTATTFTITYAYNSATGGNSTASASFSAGDSAITLPTPTRTGFTFDGWYSDNGLTSLIGAAGAGYSPASNLTAYAKWIANSFTVTYDEQGGSAVLDGSTSTGGSISSSPGSPEKAGFTFDGWFTTTSGGTTISFPYSHGQTAGFTLFAQWSPAATTSTRSTTTTTTSTTTPTTTSTITVAPNATSPVNQSSGNAPTQTSTPSTSTSSTSPLTTTTTQAPTSSTDAPISVSDIEDFINATTERISVLANEADTRKGAALIIDGKTVPVTVETTTTSTTMSYGDASLEVKCFDIDGDPITLSAEGRFTLQRGDVVSMSATGFAPGSKINAALFSDPVALGTASTNDAGQVTQQWGVPDTMTPGDHTLVFSGDLANVKNTVFGLRIIVDKQSLVLRIASNTWTRITIALGLFVGLLIPANRRRRKTA